MHLTRLMSLPTLFWANLAAFSWLGSLRLEAFRIPGRKVFLCQGLTSYAMSSQKFTLAFSYHEESKK